MPSAAQRGACAPRLALNSAHSRESWATTPRIPRELWRAVQRKFKLLDAAARLDDLSVPGGNRLERLKGRRHTLPAASLVSAVVASPCRTSRFGTNGSGRARMMHRQGEARACRTSEDRPVAQIAGQMGHHCQSRRCMRRDDVTLLLPPPSFPSVRQLPPNRWSSSGYTYRLTPKGSDGRLLLARCHAVARRLA
jgi:hypothetical protein